MPEKAPAFILSDRRPAGRFHTEEEHAVYRSSQAGSSPVSNPESWVWEHSEDRNKEWSHKEKMDREGSVGWGEKQKWVSEPTGFVGKLRD